MKLGEVRKIYSEQLWAYQNEKQKLAKQKEELEQKMQATEDGREQFGEETARVEAAYEAVVNKYDEYQEYMENLNALWTAQTNAETAKQQGEAMAEYAQDVGKIIEVARRIMKGGEGSASG